MEILEKEELEKLNKDQLLDHIMRQVEDIDRKRGYSANVSKFQLLNYPKDVLVNIAITNNNYITDQNLM